MKQILVNLYKFSELSETAQKKAIEKQYDISIDYEWWDFIYDDASRIGLKINAFDIYRKSIDITYEDNPDDVANAIFKEFGEGVDIYRYAKEYITNYNKIEQLVEDDEIFASDDLVELNNDFLHDLGEIFLSHLESEYEYRTSDEAIGEELEINEYYFTSDGSRFYNI